MKKLHQFQPTVGESKLEDRVVLSHFGLRGRIPAFFALQGPSIPAYPTSAVSQVGVAISLDYTAAMNNQTKIAQKLASNLVTNPNVVAVTQAAVNSTLQNVAVNLSNGLTAAAHTLMPFGVQNSIHQASLATQLTGITVVGGAAAASPLVNVLNNFGAVFGNDTFTVDAGNQAAVADFLKTVDPATGVIPILGHLGAAQTASNAVLQNWVTVGTSSGDFVVV